MGREVNLENREKVVEAYNRNGGNVSATAKELGVKRQTVQYHLKRIGVKKPVAGGSIEGVQPSRMPLPRPGQVKRYILTSAQNNTHIHEAVWANLMALADHYNAQVLVGTFSYNQNAYGPLSVKRNTKKERQSKPWYHEKVLEFIHDERIEIAPGLVWCGEMNIQPTAVDPLSGLETYSHRKSAIFPHAKHALASIAALPGEGVKFNYTTGTVTQKNYIQKKAGLTAEHHHSYGGLLVEVDSDGVWFVRQLDADDAGNIYDLDLLASEGAVTKGHRVEAITWGDFHAATMDHSVVTASLAKGTGMLETLRPSHQFIHDVLEGVSVNHHGAKDPHEQFKKFQRGFLSVKAELENTGRALWAYTRPWAQMHVVDSNHDRWLWKWLKEHDYRRDPMNALLFLKLQTAVYEAIERRDKSFNLTEAAIRPFMKETQDTARIHFMRIDESFKTCDGRIENGMHGDLGPNGARGTPANLNKIGRRANTGHTHAAQIVNGLYVAGTSTTLDMGYNKGPSSWSHSHVVTYPNGKRAIITMYEGKWRA